MKCFFHSADLDGKCSGAIVRRNFPDCEMIGINYGDEFPWAAIAVGEKVFMVDFCLQPFEDMLQLRNQAELVWIDHHKTSIEESHGHGRFAGTRCVGIAACELTWEYFHPHNLMPRAVRLLGRYDVWDHEDLDTLPFQMGMRTIGDTGPDAQVWDQLLDRHASEAAIHNFGQKGSTIMAYKAQSDRARCNVAAFETELDGLRCIALNSALCNSQTFASVWDPDRFDAMLAFYWTAKGFWTVSLYVDDRDDVDVSVVAKAHGGGGHKEAAGFQCAELPFDLRQRAEQ